MSKSMFICQNCGAVLKKWAGQCPECHEWNTITEEKEEGGLITHNEATGKIKKEEGTLLNFENLDKVKFRLYDNRVVISFSKKSFYRFHNFT